MARRSISATRARRAAIPRGGGAARAESGGVDTEDAEPSYRTVFEPFRIKQVEPIKRTTRAQRRDYLRRAKHNLFNLRSEDVMLDFLTDSGTGAMSTAQWAGLMVGDESYAGSPSFERFEAAVQHLFPFTHILPTHQGRAAEKILFGALGAEGKVIPNNTHFDTTRAHVEQTGAEAVDLVEEHDTSDVAPFKGNMDVAALRRLLESRPGDVPCVIVTVTNNSSGGQPVSLANLRATSELCREHGVPLFLDACRFAENAYFIKTREAGNEGRSIEDITREMASLCDGMTMSAKKDALVNIGGWLALNDDALAERCKEQLILTEGFLTYGGLSGRDLEAIAAGLREVVDEDYLQYRVRSTQYLGYALLEEGIPVVQPLGAHAVYIDAGKLLLDMPRGEFPGHAVACALYEEGGIRACEIGTLMFGGAARTELVRLAIPRRMYTQSHIDYAAEVCARVGRLAREGRLPGYRITKEPPSLRHFSCELEPLVDDGAVARAVTSARR